MRTQVRSQLGVAAGEPEGSAGAADSDVLAAAVEPGETAGAANSAVGHHALPVAVAVAVAPPEPHQRHP